MAHPCNSHRKSSPRSQHKSDDQFLTMESHGPKVSLKRICIYKHIINMISGQGMVVHAFNLRTQEAEADGTQ